MYFLNLAFSDANFPKICHKFWPFTLNRIFPKNWHNFGPFTPGLIFPNISRIFGTFPEYKFWEFSFCVFVILNLPYVSVALLNLPWAYCRSVGLLVVFDAVSSECGARTEFPEPNFFQKSATILEFSRIQTHSALPPAWRSNIYCFFLEFSHVFPLLWIYRMCLPLEFIMRFEIYISDFGGCSTTLLDAASTKTLCSQIFQACWPWIRVFFLVPLILHRKDRWYRLAILADWSSTTEPVAYFHITTFSH